MGKLSIFIFDQTLKGFFLDIMEGYGFQFSTVELRDQTFTVKTVTVIYRSAISFIFVDAIRRAVILCIDYVFKTDLAGLGGRGDGKKGAIEIGKKHSMSDSESEPV